MANIIVSLTILFIIGLSISKIIMEKRRGSKCVGCAISGECATNNKKKDKMAEQRIAIKEL